MFSVHSNLRQSREWWMQNSADIIPTGLSKIIRPRRTSGMAGVRKRLYDRPTNSHMFFAHSIEGRDRTAWQPLAEHLQSVSRLTSQRGQKFRAARLGAVIGLLHDLGKYAPEFQDYIAGRGQSPDHATAGAQEIQKLAAPNGPDRFAALIGAYCIAGHHAGLSNRRAK
jgi:hypothetical protein